MATLKDRAEKKACVERIVTMLAGEFCWTGFAEQHHDALMCLPLDTLTLLLRTMHHLAGREPR